MPENKHFAGYPSAFVYAEPTLDRDKPSAAVIDHLLWGDYVNVLGGSHARRNGFRRVSIRGSRIGWMLEGTFQKKRLLEVVFVDIGQGDGCLLVTPEDDHFVIDAGQGDNMYRFLKWRYRFQRQEEAFHFKGGVITHPDSDHYGGFRYLFADDKVHFDTLYHNGLVERHGGKTEQLGSRAWTERPRRSYCTEIIRSKSALKRFLDHADWRARGRRGDKMYPAMLEAGLDNGSFSRFEELDVRSGGGFLKGYEADKPLTMRILGPVSEDIDNHRRVLRWFGSHGKTKNGHSIIFRVEYGKVSMLLGGDLNIPSEQLLLTHHTRLQRLPSESDAEAYAEFREQARAVFQVDVAKTCHHGSADFFRPYLDATNPIVTVISSGDEESHSHPRADTLGTVGKYQRGVRSLLFNTELARSSGERLAIPSRLRLSIERLSAEIVGLEVERAAEDLTEDEIETIDARLDSKREGRERLWKVLGRSVSVYGAINLRTDGERIVLAQKLEKKRGNTEWDIYRLEHDGSDFHYRSKYE